MTRIVSGKARGRRLVTPAGKGTRPTADRCKEAVFDRIGPRVEGARVLDLFAGSGQMGIEALSRGAASAVFVDAARAAVSAIRKNLADCAFDAPTEIVELPLPGAVSRLRAALDRTAVDARTKNLLPQAAPPTDADGSATGRADHAPIAPFDLVYIDPPYDEAASMKARLLRALHDEGLLAAGAFVVFESSSLDAPSRSELRKLEKRLKKAARGEAEMPASAGVFADVPEAYRLAGVCRQGAALVEFFRYIIQEEGDAK